MQRSRSRNFKEVIGHVEVLSKWLEIDNGWAFGLPSDTTVGDYLNVAHKICQRLQRLSKFDKKFLESEDGSPNFELLLREVGVASEHEMNVSTKLVVPRFIEDMNVLNTIPPGILLRLLKSYEIDHLYHFTLLFVQYALVIRNTLDVPELKTLPPEFESENLNLDFEMRGVYFEKPSNKGTSEEYDRIHKLLNADFVVNMTVPQVEAPRIPLMIDASTETETVPIKPEMPIPILCDQGIQWEDPGQESPVSEIRPSPTSSEITSPGRPISATDSSGSDMVGDQEHNGSNLNTLDTIYPEFVDQAVQTIIEDTTQSATYSEYTQFDFEDEAEEEEDLDSSVVELIEHRFPVDQAVQVDVKAVTYSKSCQFAYQKDAVDVVTQTVVEAEKEEERIKEEVSAPSPAPQRPEFTDQDTQTIVLPTCAQTTQLVRSDLIPTTSSTTQCSVPCPILCNVSTQSPITTLIDQEVQSDPDPFCTSLADQISAALADASFEMPSTAFNRSIQCNFSDSLPLPRPATVNVATQSDDSLDTTDVLTAVRRLEKRIATFTRNFPRDSVQIESMHEDLRATLARLDAVVVAAQKAEKAKVDNRTAYWMALGTLILAPVVCALGVVTHRIDVVGRPPI